MTLTIAVLVLNKPGARVSGLEKSFYDLVCGSALVVLDEAPDPGSDQSDWAVRIDPAVPGSRGGTVCGDLGACGAVYTALTAYLGKEGQPVTNPVVYEFTTMLDVSVKPGEQQAALRRLNRHHAGVDSFPLDTPVAMPPALVEATQNLVAVSRRVAVVSVHADGNVSCRFAGDPIPEAVP